MRLICFWCFVLAVVKAQNDFYAPQTFKQHLDDYQRGLFTPATNKDAPPPSNAQNWGPGQDWKNPSQSTGPVTFKPEPWRIPYVSKQQQAAILHHKQALTADGAFQFEFASDNGVAVGEQTQPDGSRVGAYQYKDPSGQLVQLKYKAGKEGFQILEGSHLPKSPEPVAPPTQDNHYKQAYMQQRQQYELQQQYNLQRPDPQYNWRNEAPEGQKAAGAQFVQNWKPQGPYDDGQYHENDVDKGPHSFGAGYAFAFKG